MVIMRGRKREKKRCAGCCDINTLHGEKFVESTERSKDKQPSNASKCVIRSWRKLFMEALMVSVRVNRAEHRTN